MKKLTLFLAAAVLALAPMTASARVVFFGGPVIGAGFYGPCWGPCFGPAYGFYGAPPTGEVKIDTKANDAEVFIDGAFAGSTKDAKTMHLRPGTYNIEVRHAGQEALNEQVFVTAGKTVHLHPAI